MDKDKDIIFIIPTNNSKPIKIISESPHDWKLLEVKPHVNEMYDFTLHREPTEQERNRILEELFGTIKIGVYRIDEEN